MVVFVPACLLPGRKKDLKNHMALKPVMHKLSEGCMEETNRHTQSVKRMEWVPERTRAKRSEWSGPWSWIDSLCFEGGSLWLGALGNRDGRACTECGLPGGTEQAFPNDEARPRVSERVKNAVMREMREGLARRRQGIPGWHKSRRKRERKASHLK